MKIKWVTCAFLMLVEVAMRLSAQQSTADRKLFEDTKVKAEQGDAISQNSLGEIYDFGFYGVAKDYEEAARWYRKAAEQGADNAQNNLSILYFSGLGVKQDYVETVKWAQKAADQNNPQAQFNLGTCYQDGLGIEKSAVEAVKWYRKAAEQGYSDAQLNLGKCYSSGRGVVKDEVEAVKWYRKAANQDNAKAQYNLGVCYANCTGEVKDEVEAVKWYRKAAEQGYSDAQFNLGCAYFNGNGLPKDYIEAYKWYNLASAQGHEDARKALLIVEQKITPEQIAEGQRVSREFVPRKKVQKTDSFNMDFPAISASPTATGTGFFITDDGYFVSNNHVVKDATKVRIVTGAGTFEAKVIKTDAANDLALLKAEGRFAPLPISPSRGVKLGNTVATVGFPDPTLQGFSPKLAKGEIASLSGAADDARYFQISVPVQPGNSGGALVDARGNVVGIVSAKLSARAALASSGALPENVNYAVKSSFLLSFLESVPAVANKLKDPLTAERKFEDVVKSAQDAAVLILVY